jgi:hypothetical protein
VTAARSAPSRGGPSATGTYFRAAGSRSSLAFGPSGPPFFVESHACVLHVEGARWCRTSWRRRFNRRDQSSASPLERARQLGPPELRTLPATMCRAFHVEQRSPTTRRAGMPLRADSRSTSNSGVRRRDAPACRCEPTVVPRRTRANLVSDDCSRASGAGATRPETRGLSISPGTAIAVRGLRRPRGTTRALSSRPRATADLRCSTWNKNPAGPCTGHRASCETTRVFHVEQEPRRPLHRASC